MKLPLFAALILATAAAHAAGPTLQDLWNGKAEFAMTGETLDTDTRSGLHFISEVKQPDGRYFVYYILNEGEVTVGGGRFPLQCVGLAYTTDWITFTDAGRVMPRGGPGSFDERIASFADVWKDDDGSWHLVYEAAGTTEEYPGDVAYATSPDGVHWTKHGIILKHRGEAERNNNGTPSLYKEGGVWYLFYHGFDGTDVRNFGASGPSLTSLTRLNGGRPLVDTSPGGLDSGTAGRRSIIRQDGFYWMVYECSTEQPFDKARWCSGLARSADLLTWEKWQGTGGPVLPQIPTFGNDGPEWVTTPDGKLNILFRQRGNTTGRATLVWKEASAREWVFQAGDLSHRTGRQEAGGWSADPASDRAGHLSFGPYAVDITPGLRRAIFRLKLDDLSPAKSGETIAVLDVFDGTASKVISSQRLLRADFNEAGAWQDFPLGFTAAAGQRLEFRVYWNGRAKLQQESVRVR